MNGDSAKIGHDAAHRIDLLSRKNLEVRGVSDVISFDEQLVVLNTLCGNLEIEGEALQVQVLNTADGIVCLEGKIDSLHYYETGTEEKDGKKRFFGKLFR